MSYMIIFTKGETTHPNRPRGRKRNVSETGKGVNIRGEGLGIGPVGPADRSKNLRNILKNSNNKK